MTAPGARPDVATLRSGARELTQVPEPPPRRATRLVLPLALLAAFVGVFLYAARDALRPRRSVHVVPVVVKTSAEATGAGEVVATAAGWVEPDPFPVHVSTLADGVVAEMLVLEGQEVQAGQVLARLVPDDAELALRRAEAELAAATAAVDVAAARATAAETDWAHPTELERELGRARAAHDAARAARARLDAEIAMAEAQLAVLHDDARRLAALLPSRSATEAEVTRAQLEVAVQDANVAAARARRAELDAEIAATRADLAAADERLRLRVADTRELQAARADLALARASEARARAARDEARLRRERMEIRAPVAGVVMRRLGEPGSRLMLGMDGMEASWVVDLYDPARLQVRVDVALADAARIGVGTRARVVAESYRDAPLEGEVSRLVHYADIQKNTAQAKVRLVAPPAGLKPETLARVEFFGSGQAAPGATGARRVWAPRELVAGGRALVAGAGDVAELRDVKLGGGHDGAWVEVLDGLLPGDRLIDAPPDAAPQPGEHVRIEGESTR